MESKIEELKVGDIIYVQFGYDFIKARYLGSGMARGTWNGFFLDLNERRWVRLPKRPLIETIKDLFK